MPLVKKRRGNITADFLKSRQFAMCEKDFYRLKVNFNDKHIRMIEARLIDETWFVRYIVNGINATYEYVFMDEVDTLIFLLGANDIIPI